MKNSELLLKVKKEGYNSLSMFELRRLSNIAWKEDSFTLNGLVRYVQRSNDEAINAMLVKTGIDKSVITVKWVLKNCDPNLLVKKTKNKLTDKLELTNEKKEFFSLWLISGTIQRFEASIRALASSSRPKVIEPEKNELQKAKEEEKKAAAKVAANKKRNAEAKKKKLAEAKNVKIDEAKNAAEKNKAA